LPVLHAPFPNPYRPQGCESTDASLAALEDIFKREVPAEEVAAIFVEPIQGEGGYIIPLKPFLREIRALCDELGILLVVDEVQTGCYRTGTFLASEQFGVKPDIVCLSKAIGGGLPLGAMVASEEVTTWLPGSHAGTFAGNNVACAAGLAVLDILSGEGFGAHVVDAGLHLLQRLNELQQDYDSSEMCVGWGSWRQSNSFSVRKRRSLRQKNDGLSSMTHSKTAWPCCQRGNPRFDFAPR